MLAREIIYILARKRWALNIRLSSLLHINGKDCLCHFVHIIYTSLEIWFCFCSIRKVVASDSVYQQNVYIVIWGYHSGKMSVLVFCFHLQSWRWRQDVPLKHRYLPTSPHIITTHKTNTDMYMQWFKQFTIHYCWLCIITNNLSYSVFDLHVIYTF